MICLLVKKERGNADFPPNGGMRMEARRAIVDGITDPLGLTRMDRVDGLQTLEVLHGTSANCGAEA
jgi:hypothetical protein